MAIAAAEHALGCALPDCLRHLYSQTNGVSAHYGTRLVMPIAKAVQENETLRHFADLRPLYMPFDHMLVFGGPGNGDLFFYPIREMDRSLAKSSSGTTSPTAGATSPITYKISFFAMLPTLSNSSGIPDPWLAVVR